MIKITYDDLRKLEQIDIGTIGTIYRYDEKTVYKIYHDIIKTDFGHRYENPALKYPKRKIKQLEEKRKNIKYTDFFIDTIQYETRFKGFSFPYYNEGTLEDRISKEANEKIDIAFQALRNGSELIENNIYICDCSPRNIMLHNGEVKFTDLDDFRTIVTKYYEAVHYNKAYLDLGNTILKLFSEYRVNDRIGAAKYYVERKYIFMIVSKKAIKKYIEDKSIGHNFLLVTEQSNIDLIKGWKSKNQSDILMSFNSTDYDKKHLTEIAREFRKEGIPLYDFADRDFLDQYFQSQNAASLHELRGNQFIKTK